MRQALQAIMRDPPPLELRRAVWLSLSGFLDAWGLFEQTMELKAILEMPRR